MRKALIGSLMVLALAAFTSPAFAQDKDKGASVFAANGCSMCHSIAGKGNPKGPRASARSCLPLKSAAGSPTRQAAPRRPRPTASLRWR